jgi:hypothetical protein
VVALDPQAVEVHRERLRILQRPPDVIPAGRRPDLRVVASAHDDHVAVERRVHPQVGRQDDPTLTVELDLRRPAEDVALKGTGSRVGQGQGRRLVGELLPAVAGQDGQAVI